MKLVYLFSRIQAGKVMVPITIHSARMPLSFGNFRGKLPKLDKKLRLDSPTALPVREQVASINICLICMDANRWYATKQSSN